MMAGTFFVSLRADAGPAAVAELSREVGATFVEIENDYDNVHEFVLPADRDLDVLDVVEMYRGHPAVVFAEPNEIADRYHKALRRYLDELRQVMLESAVDYHRVRIDEDYEQVLLRFLVGRTRTRGRR